MPVDIGEQTIRSGRNVRLDTLVRLRWLAVIGQTTAVLVVYIGLDFELPIWACLAVITLAAWLNVALRVRFRMSQRLEPDRAAWLLAFDIAELAILLFLTGGLQNPFSFLLLGAVLLSATALPPRMTVMLGAFAAACATVLIFYHYDLPWDSDEPLQLPAIYNMGVWLSLLLALGFIGVHAWQLTEEARQLAEALAATGRRADAAEYLRRAAQGWATADPDGPEQAALHRVQAAAAAEGEIPSAGEVTAKSG